MKCLACGRPVNNKRGLFDNRNRAWCNAMCLHVWALRPPPQAGPWRP